MDVQELHEGKRTRAPLSGRLECSFHPRECTNSLSLLTDSLGLDRLRLNTQVTCFSRSCAKLESGGSHASPTSRSDPAPEERGRRLRSPSKAWISGRFTRRTASVLSRFSRDARDRSAARAHRAARDIRGCRPAPLQDARPPRPRAPAIPRRLGR